MKKKGLIPLHTMKLRPLEPSNNYFQSLCRSIIFQQLSGTAASAIMKKFVALWPRKRFPTPHDVVSLTDAQFRSVGISFQKAQYLRDLSKKFLDKTISSSKIPSMTDEEIIAHLVQVKGIGEWTAHMFLIFALGRPDVLPTGDLAIKKGFVKVFRLRKTPTHEKMVELATPYNGNRTTLALYVWDRMDEEKR